MKAFYLNLGVLLVSLVVFLGAGSGGLGFGEDFWLVFAVTVCSAPVLMLVGVILAIVGLCRKQDVAWNVTALLLPLVLLLLCLLA